MSLVIHTCFVHSWCLPLPGRWWQMHHTAHCEDRETLYSYTHTNSVEKYIRTTHHQRSKNQNWTDSQGCSTFRRLWATLGEVCHTLNALQHILTKKPHNVFSKYTILCWATLTAVLGRLWPPAAGRTPLCAGERKWGWQMLAISISEILLSWWGLGLFFKVCPFKALRDFAD